jgi:CRISPR-associated exonuclease Cas4
MDHAKLNPYPNALYDSDLRLTGKPDYVVTVRGKPVPVEAKSMSSPSKPYLSHIMQLSAYCRLVESNFKLRPEKGIILYTDRAFELAYSRNLEKNLISTIEDIRASSQKPARSHDSSARCKGCGYQSICDVPLA